MTQTIVFSLWAFVSISFYSNKVWSWFFSGLLWTVLTQDNTRTAHGRAHWQPFSCMIDFFTFYEFIVDTQNSWSLFFWWGFTKLKFSICDHQNFHYVNYAKTCFKNLVCISPQNIKWAIFKRLGYTLHFYVMKPKLLRNRILCQSATYHAWTYWENWKPGQFDVCM